MSNFWSVNLPVYVLPLAREQGGQPAREARKNGPIFMAFKSLTQKLLIFILAVSLLPLGLISATSYYLAKNRITKDRVRLYLEQLARDTADKIDLTLQEKRDQIRSMLTIYTHPHSKQELTALLNRFLRVYEFYDLLILTDREGNIIAMNQVDRFENPIKEDKLTQILGRNIRDFPPEDEWFREAMAGTSFQMDWYASPLVKIVYNYESGDISRHYNISFSEPIKDLTTGKTIGVWCNIINWEAIQRILDRVEDDLEELNLFSGYAFLIKDNNMTIGHKYRKNRVYHKQDILKTSDITTRNLYGFKLSENNYLWSFQQAIIKNQSSVSYEYPAGTKKISGLARITDAFGWVCGVGIDNEDIFAPVEVLKYVLILITLVLAVAVVICTYFISHTITVPIKKLTATAQTIANGDLSQHVPITSQDEVGILGRAFNEMASSLAERNKQLLELTQNLEKKVKERTLELEKSHEELKKAYLELKAAQDQLIHSEKLASLGQLVAGIAHEIKNPLNFIYGNTEFLAQYIERVKQLVEEYEKLPSLTGEDKEQIRRLKGSINYDFIVEDLKTLIDNFSEGASRINAIVSDLRSFSRMDFDNLSEVDVHSSLDTALNLLRNQYKDRITIHKTYSRLPRIQAYEGKLNQVFMNLISNAIQAIQDKGDIWISTFVEDGHVTIKVKDNGVGIPKNQLSRIFEPFFTTKDVGEGTGLGLSISYGIIEQHQGKILVESEVGKGSTFTIKLPLKLRTDFNHETI